MSDESTPVESGRGRAGPEVQRVWGRSPTWALTVLPRLLAFAFAALAAALLAIAMFTWRPADCPAPVRGVREVAVAAAGPRDWQAVAGTPPGAEFPPSRGGDVALDGLLVGAPPGRRIEAPWRVLPAELPDGTCPSKGLLSNAGECRRGGECPTRDDAPVATTNPTCFENGFRHDEPSTCSFEPEWVVSTGLEVAPGDLIVAFRSARTGYDNESCDGPWETVDTLHLARGPEPTWGSAVLADPPPGAPTLRLDGDDVVACFPEGFYWVGTMHDSTWRLEPWPLRARPVPLAPPWPALLVAIALVGGGALLLKGARARRHLRDKVGAGAPRAAVVADLTPAALHLDVADEGRLEVPWQRVVDVFRRQGCLMMNMDPDERDFFFPRRKLHSVPLELDLARTGGKVEVVLVAGGRDRQPYRAGAIVSEGLTLVLHDGVTLPQVLARVNDVNQGAFWSWLVAIAGAAALIATLAVT
jgi:hypothetical protein